MDRVLYYTPQKNKHHGDAVADGFGCRKVSTERVIPGAMHFIGGMQFGNERILAEVRRRKEPYVFFDRAYIGGGHGSNVLRAVVNAYQHHWVIPSRGPRSWGVELQPWQTSGDCIMLVPPSSFEVAALFDAYVWAEIMIDKLRKLTQRPVFVSRKGDTEPLSSRLRRCHAVVTFTSNVAVDAIIAGVPAIVSEHSAARPMSGHCEALTAEMIENPPRPERQAWFDGLAWGQFTVNEIATGFAAEHTGFKHSEAV